MLFHNAADNNCFKERNSAIFVPALDASKAFDKVRHHKLLIKLSNIL